MHNSDIIATLYQKPNPNIAPKLIWLLSCKKESKFPREMHSERAPKNEGKVKPKYAWLAKETRKTIILWSVISAKYLSASDPNGITIIFTTARTNPCVISNLWVETDNS